MADYKVLKDLLFKNLVTQDPYFAGVQEALLNQAEKLLLVQNQNKNNNINAEDYARHIIELIEIAGHPEHFHGISILLDAYFEGKPIPN